MSQHDLVINNSSGAAVRADINNAFAAIGSMHTGAVGDLPTTFSNMVVSDTTSGHIIKRNYGNTDWDYLMPIDQRIIASAIGTDSYAVNYSPAIGSYKNGVIYRFRSDMANSGGASLNLSGLGAVTIKKYVNGVLVVLATGDIPANYICHCLYDSIINVMILLNPASGGENYITPEQYGVVGSDTVDDSLGMQDLIDDLSASGGGVIEFTPGKTYRFNVIARDNVTLRCLAGMNQVPIPLYNRYTARLKPYSDGPVISSPDIGTYVRYFNVMGLDIYGDGHLSGMSNTQGIVLNSSDRCAIHSTFVYNCGLQGIWVKQSSGLFMFGSSAVMCGRSGDAAAASYNSTSTRIGALHLGDGSYYPTDGYILYGQFGCHWVYQILGAKSSANLYYCGIYCENSFNMDFQSVNGELSDIGVYIAGGSANKFNRVRGEYSMGHGWYISGQEHQIDNCQAYNNSLDTTNTYDGFYLDANSVDIQMTSPIASSYGCTKVHRYGINDARGAGQNGQTSNRIVYPISRTHGTAAVKTAALGNAPTLGNAIMRSTDGDTTPSVSQITTLYISNTDPTSITNFDDPMEGQELAVICYDKNTTLVYNGTTFLLATGDNRKMIANKCYKFKYLNGAWHEITFGRWATLTVSPSAGAASVVVSYGFAFSTTAYMIRPYNAAAVAFDKAHGVTYYDGTYVDETSFTLKSGDGTNFAGTETYKVIPLE